MSPSPSEQQHWAAVLAEAEAAAPDDPEVARLVAEVDDLIAAAEAKVYRGTTIRRAADSTLCSGHVEKTPGGADTPPARQQEVDS